MQVPTAAPHRPAPPPNDDLRHTAAKRGWRPRPQVSTISRHRPSQRNDTSQTPASHQSPRGPAGPGRAGPTVNAIELDDPQQARWVEEFARAWRAPADGDSLVEQFRPWLRPDYRFRHPLTRGTGVGLAQFRRRFVQPLLAVIADVHGTVESWAAREDTVFIELAIDGRVGRRAIRLRACDRVTLADGLVTERQTYFDPLPLIAAVVRAPRLW